MTRTENRDYTFIFSEKCLFDTLSEINLSDMVRDMVRVTMNFNLRDKCLIQNFYVTYEVAATIFGPKKNFQLPYFSSDLDEIWYGG